MAVLDWCDSVLIGVTVRDWGEPTSELGVEPTSELDVVPTSEPDVGPTSELVVVSMVLVDLNVCGGVWLCPMLLGGAHSTCRGSP